MDHGSLDVVIMQLPAQTPIIFKKAAQSRNIVLITEENPVSFSFARSLHGCLDCTMKPPCRIPEFLELLQDIRRTTPILIAENDNLDREKRLYAVKRP